VLALRRWNKPLKTTPEEAMPKWFEPVDKALTKSSDKFTPRRALLLAVVMSALSPKNIALMLALFLAISQANLNSGDAFILLLIFVLISSVTIGVPILYAMVKGENSQEALETWKIWVIQNRGRALALLLFVLGGIVILNGVISLVERLAVA
jgi:threonine/homoserine/homoserine lactone efflux protein